MKRHMDVKGKKNHMKREGKGLKVVEIHYMPMPDADSRLSRAIDVLLCSVASRASPLEKSTEDPRHAPSEEAPNRGGKDSNKRQDHEQVC